MFKRNSLLALLLLTAVMISGCLGGNSETAYTVQGIVMDDENAPLANVEILVSDIQGNLISAQPFKTKEDGRFNLSLSKGTYTIRPELDQYIFNPTSKSVSNKTDNLKFTGTWSEWVELNFESLERIDGGNVLEPIYADASAVQSALPAVAIANDGEVEIPIEAWEDNNSYNSERAGRYTFTAVLGEIPKGYLNSHNKTITVEITILPEEPFIIEINGENYTMILDDLPEGLSWHEDTKTLTLDGVEEYSILQTNPNQSINLHVESDSTLYIPNTLYALDFNDGINISGNPGTKLTLQSRIKGENITVDGIELEINGRFGSIKCIEGNVTVKNDAKLNIIISSHSAWYASTSGVYGVFGQLILQDTSSAIIDISIKSSTGNWSGAAKDNIHGVNSLRLEGTGDCEIIILNESGGKSVAVGEIAEIAPGYTVEGDPTGEYVRYYQ